MGALLRVFSALGIVGVLGAPGVPAAPGITGGTLHAQAAARRPMPSGDRAAATRTRPAPGAGQALDPGHARRAPGARRGVPIVCVGLPGCGFAHGSTLAAHGTLLALRGAIPLLIVGSDLVLTEGPGGLGSGLGGTSTDGALTGGLRLIIRPRHADVFVDGRYAGPVSRFSGDLRRLRLGRGLHAIEVLAEGYEPLVLDALVEIGGSATYRGTLRARPAGR